MIDASLAQLVEHDTLNVGVQGSSPWGGTKAEDESLPLFFVPIPGDTGLSVPNPPVYRSSWSLTPHEK